MFLTEYNEELHERTCREEGRMEGLKKGIEKGRMEGITGIIRTLRKLGHGDDEIQRILKEAYDLTGSEVEGYMR